ncbi:hypothetical protein [Nostoc sp.]|uniref:hypothetical protein n=1 Tax=Nostoc sp. TaxID=1180 RepID=UPI002FFADF5A
MAQALRDWALLISPSSPSSPSSPTPHSHSPLPIPQLKDILKTLLANYALDKLKIEIAGNSHPAFPYPIL